MAKQLKRPYWIHIGFIKDPAGNDAQVVSVEGCVCDPSAQNDFDRSGASVRGDLAYDASKTVSEIASAAVAALEAKAGI